MAAGSDVNATPLQTPQTQGAQPQPGAAPNLCWCCRSVLLPFLQQFPSPNPLTQEKKSPERVEIPRKVLPLWQGHVSNGLIGANFTTSLRNEELNKALPAV